MSTSKNEEDFKSLTERHPEIALLLELGHDISNFSNGFKAKTRNTFILSPGGSDMFGMKATKDTLLIGVPEHLFKICLEVPFEGISLLEKSYGMFLRFRSQPQTVGNNGPVSQAIRILERKSVRKAITERNIRIAKLVGMDEKGEITDGSIEISLPLEMISELGWENI